MDLKNKKVCCTGNSKGIGKGITDFLRKEGCIVPDISRSVGYDLTKESGLENLFKRYSNFDIVINNLGGGGRWGNNILEFDEWDEVYQKNAGIAVKITMNYLPKMILNKEGRVITIASIYGSRPGGYPWFSMAKASEIAFMRSMENRYEGVTFNSISPGQVNIREGDNYKIEPIHIAQQVYLLCLNGRDGQDI